MRIANEIARIAIADAKTIADATTVLDQIDDSFGVFLMEYLEDVIEKRSAWWCEDDCFGPKDWPNMEGDYQAYYEIAFCGDETYWLLHVAGESSRSLGLALVIEPSLLGGKDYAKRLQKFFDENYEQLEGAELLSPCFSKDKLYIVFPFKVGLKQIADEYPNWEDAVSQEFDAALRNLLKAHKVIDGFVKSL